MLGQSMALQGIADAKYKLICTDVSTYGKQICGGIFFKCILGIEFSVLL
jgi:hypothetical protein